MLNQLFIAILMLLTLWARGESQGLDPSTPAKEYIRLNGQMIAIENAPQQAGAVATRPMKEKQLKTITNQPALPGAFVILPPLTARDETGARLLSFSHLNMVPLPLHTSVSASGLNSSLFRRSWLTLPQSTSFSSLAKALEKTP